MVGLARDLDDSLNIRMGPKSTRTSGGIVTAHRKLGTTASLPLCSADVAELVPTPARDVVATLSEFDDVSALRALLPTVVRGHPQHSLVLTGVAHVGGTVCSGLAVATGALITSVADEGKRAISCGADECGAVVTVHSVSGAEFFRLLSQEMEDRVWVRMVWTQDIELDGSGTAMALGREEGFVPDRGFEQMSEALDIVHMPTFRNPEDSTVDLNPADTTLGPSGPGAIQRLIPQALIHRRHSPAFGYYLGSTSTRLTSPLL